MTIPLITETDLAARRIDTSNTTAIAALIESASDMIRLAAGTTITTSTDTVKLDGNPGPWLALPGYASRNAIDVSIDGRAVTDFRETASGQLWRQGGWALDSGPATVTLTYTQGIAKAPAAVIDLACALVAGGLSSVAEGYDPHRSVAYERIDDFQVGYRQGEGEIVSVMELPVGTRNWLAGLFGTQSYVTGER